METNNLISILKANKKTILRGLGFLVFVSFSISAFSLWQENREEKIIEEIVTDTSVPYNVKTLFSPEKKLEPAEVRDELAILNPYLPIYVRNFSTEAGIPTFISIYHSKSDPDHFVRVEINNINYQNVSGDINHNQDALAFKESFIHAKSMIKALDVDPNSLYFVFGTREYIHETASSWVEEFNLLD